MTLNASKPGALAARRHCTENAGVPALQASESGWTYLSEFAPDNHAFRGAARQIKYSPKRSRMFPLGNYRLNTWLNAALALRQSSAPDGETDDLPLRTTRSLLDMHCWRQYAGARQ